MIERPILFSGAMVRAILAGRKSQTRRVVKLIGAEVVEEAITGPWPFSPQHDDWLACPFGRVGDRLWVRETWCFAHPDYHDEAEGLRLGKPMRDGRWCHYAASDDDVDFGDNKSTWRPSIHMPRWASRLMLEVTGVRVERLCDVSEEDAVAEGVEVHMMPEEWRAVRQQHGRNEAITFDREPSADLIAALRLRDVTHVPARPMRSAVAGFHSLWESINGRGSWDANPWVWAIAFKRVTP